MLEILSAYAVFNAKHSWEKNSATVMFVFRDDRDYLEMRLYYVPEQLLHFHHLVTH